MAMMVSFSPRKPGCVLLASDLKSIISKLERVWRKLATRSTQNLVAR
jgi:hypothetical protein